MSKPVRAIFTSEFWPGATARGLVAGLRAAGWLVDEINTLKYFSSSTDIGARIEARLRHSSRRAALQRAILSSAARHRANVFVTVKGVDLAPATIDALRRQDVLSVNYHPDYHFNDVPLADLARYDLVATTKSFQMDMLQEVMPPRGAAFIHHGYSPQVHRKLPSPPDKTVDVLYVGNASAAKGALMIALAEALPNIAIRVVGARWEDHARGTALAQAIAGHQSSGDYYAAEIASAKITLGIHMGADPRTGFADRVSTRTFEIPACGGFMLHVDNDEVRSLYDVPSEIDTFVDADDLVAKVRYWLDHPEERDAVAARGHARAVPAYSYTERGLELAALVERKLGRTAD